MPRALLLLLLTLNAAAAHAQTAVATPAPGPQADTAVVAADGTAHITRMVPLPPGLSTEARAAWSKPGTDAPTMEPDVGKRRAATQAWQDAAGKRSAAVYPVKITESTMAGVPVHLIDPLADAATGPASGPGMGGVYSLHYSVIKDRTPPVVLGKPSGDLLLPRINHSGLNTLFCKRLSTPTESPYASTAAASTQTPAAATCS